MKRTLRDDDLERIMEIVEEYNLCFTIDDAEQLWAKKLSEEGDSYELPWTHDDLYNTIIDYINQ